MRRSFLILSIILLSVGVISLASCSGHRQESSQDTIIAIDTTTSTDTTTTLPKDSVTAKADTLPDPPERLDHVPQDVIALFEQEGHRDEYMSGVIAEIAKSSPSYARRLVNSSHSRFIVVDKGRMKVILYNRYGHEIVSYGMACARNYGTKRGKADCRTPEGFFSVQGIYDSTDWLFTDDNGRTSKKKGQFGPRFIRLSIPTTTQIGIHGTCAPGSIGGRVSHGCIRLTNKNILQLVKLVKPGMPVIVIPGKRDREVNLQEGNDIVSFTTSSKYAIPDAERRQILASIEPDSIESETKETIEVPTDSIISQPADTTAIPSEPTAE